jgi:acyl-CoA reductase-like NAD-dependent aldehyde dehydrogenase
MCTRRSTTLSSMLSCTCVGYQRGDPLSEDTYIGAITRAQQLDVLDGSGGRCPAQGRDAAGGRPARHRAGQLVRGHRVARTAITRMSLMRDESFGPIIGIRRSRATRGRAS